VECIGGPLTDYDLQSQWMSASAQDDVTIHLDLGAVYDTFDVQIYFGYKPQVLEVWVSTDDIT